MTLNDGVYMYTQRVLGSSFTHAIQVHYFFIMSCSMLEKLQPQKVIKLSEKSAIKNHLPSWHSKTCCKMPKDVILHSGWEVSPHLAYSSDLYHHRINIDSIAPTLIMNNVNFRRFKLCLQWAVQYWGMCYDYHVKVNDSTIQYTNHNTECHICNITFEIPW